MLVGFPIFGGERVTIRAGRAAHDVPLVVTGIPGGVVPCPIIGHRAFNGEEAPVIVGNDEEIRLGRAVVGHRIFCRVDLPLTDGRSAVGRNVFNTDRELMCEARPARPDVRLR
jgi:hypothetical protein